MEVATIIYKAKDGRTFTDPLECEEYEKTLGILPNSVGNLVQLLEERNPNDYIFGIVLIKENDEYSVYMRATFCVDEKLEDYVNLDELTKEQRYFIYTIRDLQNFLRKKDQDAPCQWWIVYSGDIDQRTTCGMMSNFNRECWPSNAKDV